MNINSTSIDTLKQKTMILTGDGVDRNIYNSIGSEIKQNLGVDAFVIFRDTVIGDSGQFWIEENDFAYMWKRIVRSLKSKE